MNEVPTFMYWFAYAYLFFWFVIGFIVVLLFSAAVCVKDKIKDRRDKKSEEGDITR